MIMNMAMVRIIQRRAVVIRHTRIIFLTTSFFSLNLRSLLRSSNDIGPSGGAAVAAILPRLTALQALVLEYLQSPTPWTPRARQ